MRDMLTALVIAGQITLEEAEAVEADPIYRTGYAFAPLRVQVADYRAALARVREKETA